MNARVLTGSKKEIAEQLAGLSGDVLEAIVFVEELPGPRATDHNLFAEMEPFTVREADADDSRAAIYQHREGE